MIEEVWYYLLKRLNGEEFVASSAIIKFGFRIRTRTGLMVDKVLIHARDEADAERKLRQMYQHCSILECTVHKPGNSRVFATAG